MAKQRWPDLTSHDKRVRMVALELSKPGAESKMMLVLIGAEHYPDAADALGFSRADNGLYFRPKTVLKREDLPLLRKHFPNMSIREMDVEDISMRIEGFRSVLRAMRPPAVKSDMAEGAAAESSDEIVEEAALDDEDLLQAIYEPLSAMPSNDAKIPRNLALATRHALSRVERDYGDIDQYVADAMSSTTGELAERLDAEQVDAVALAQYAIDQGRGFILGDAPGRGKGRSIAAIISMNVRKGRRVLFLSEKANLMSAMYRDLGDVDGLGVVNIYSPNPQMIIEDLVTGDAVYQSTQEELKEISKNRRIPADYNLVMSTYSQIRTVMGETGSDDDANRMDLLLEYAGGALIIADEADVAAGDTSNTFHNLRKIINKASGVIFSSATAIRDPGAIALFDEAFPSGMGSRSVAATLKNSGEAAQEALSEMLCRDGVMIVRQHDYSGLKLHMQVDSKRKEQHVEHADKLAEILSAVSYLSGDIAGMVDDRNDALRESIEKSELAKVTRQVASGRSRSQMTPQQIVQQQGHKRNITKQLKKLGIGYSHFGSRLYNLGRQFLLASSIPAAIDRAIEAVEAGRKPIIVMDNTMNSLLYDSLHSDDNLDMFDDLLGDESGGADLPTFRDVLNKLLDRVFLVKSLDANGNTVYLDVTTDSPDFIVAKKNIRNLIAKFPDIDVMPIDTIHKVMSKAGYVGEEITGRTLKIAVDDAGKEVIVKRVPPNRNGVLRQFNSAAGVDGGLDYLVINRAAAAGNDMHSSKKFTDQRVREMIFAQQPDAADKLEQLMGRIMRKDIVEGAEPQYTIISTGLPIELYHRAALNNKARQLSACMTSNRESRITTDVPDILNSFGNSVAKEFLIDNDVIAERLRIDVVDESGHDSKNYVNMMLSRIQLMSVAEQEDIIGKLNSLFFQRLDELAMIGINPIKSSHYDWSARIVKDTLYRGIESTKDTSFDSPVYLRDIEYDETIYPIKFMEVEKAVEASIKRLNSSAQIGGDPTLLKLKAHIDSERATIASKLLTSRHFSLQQALDDDVITAAKKFWINTEKILSIIEGFAPGSVIVTTNTQGKPSEAVVADFIYKGSYGVTQQKTGQFSFNPEGYELGMLSNYTIVMAIPGESKFYDASLASLLNYDDAFEITGINIADLKNNKIAHAFDDIPNGARTVKKTLLHGNVYQASQMMGPKGSIVTYTDENGDHNRGVLLPSSMNKELELELRWLPQPVRDPSDIVGAMSAAASLGKTNKVGRTGSGTRVSYPRVFATTKISRNNQWGGSRSLGGDKAMIATTYNPKSGDVTTTFYMPKLKDRSPKNYSADTGVIKLAKASADSVMAIAAAQVLGGAPAVDPSTLSVQFKEPTSRRSGHIIIENDHKLVARLIQLSQKEQGETYFLDPDVVDTYNRLKVNSAPAPKDPALAAAAP